MGRKFQANRGGHAPGHLREWFEQYIEADQKIEGDVKEEIVEYLTQRRIALRGRSIEEWLLGQLWDCTDIVPSALRSSVALVTDAEHFTYGAAARALKAIEAKH